METNINSDLFKRFQPKRKLELIDRLTDSELRKVSENTIKRIIREAGTRLHKSRDKRLTISESQRAGNRWNSTVNGVENIKGKLYVSLYVQYSNTDTDTSEHYATFFAQGEYHGQVKGSDSHGNTRFYYFTYDDGDKMNVLRSILREYVLRKYHSKLQEA